MKNKILSVLIAAAVALQIITPVGVILYSEAVKAGVLKNGKEFTFFVDANPCPEDNEIHIQILEKDSYSGKYIRSSSLYHAYRDREFAEVRTKNGEDYIGRITNNKPYDCEYIRLTESNVQKLSIYKAADLENLRVLHNATITVKIYEGNVAVTGLFVDGVPVEEWKWGSGDGAAVFKDGGTSIFGEYEDELVDFSE